MKFLRNLVFLSLLVGFFVTVPSSKAVSQSVTCKGFTFTHGAVIGNNNGDVITKILNNRVYVERNQVIEDNLGIYYAMSPQNYSNLNQDQWWGCVNPSDPSTSGFNFLGPVIYDPTTGQNTIKCGSATITNNTYLSYWPDNHPNPGPNDAKTYFVPKIVDGVIRIAAIRKENPNTLQPSDLLGGPNDNSGSLNGSFQFNYLNPATGIDLSEDQIKGCIYRSAVKYPDSAPNNCTENPVIGTFSSISVTGLTFSFTGPQSLKWRVKSGGSTVANGTSATANNVSITFGSTLSYGDYTLEIEGGDCTSNVNSKTFTISKPQCNQAPIIGAISSITQTGLIFSFSGNGLPNLTWSIKNSAGNATLQSGKTGSVNNAGVTLSFGSISYGEYILEIEGGDCSSTANSKAFTITSPICTAPPIILSIANITSTGLTVDFTGAISANSVDWMIKNGAGQTVASFNKTGTSGASSMNIGFSFLKNGSYTLEVSAADCNSTVSSKGFQMDVPKPNCGSGPRITSLSQINNNSLQLLFDGSGVGSIAWRILNSTGTTSLESGEVIPVHNHPTLAYNLVNGTYKLEIQGGTTCESTPVTLNFTIGPLPIYISNFDGVAKKEGVALSWNVVSEKNGEGFQVLRYDDKVKTPQIIASVPLREEKIGTYSYLDANPANGTNYYQLKQIDTDGSFTTSRIINVSFDGVYGMFMAPNPGKDFVDVEFESRVDGMASFETYSASGIKVLNGRQKVKIGNNKIRMNISELSEGNYILKMENGDTSKSLRFLKVL